MFILFYNIQFSKLKKKDFASVGSLNVEAIFVKLAK